jgi:hypothetical protein
LPDEPPEGGLRWAPGALDGVKGHHAAAGGEALRTKQVVKALRQLASEPTEANLTHVYRLSKDSILGVVDPVIEALARLHVEPARVHAIGRVLALEAPDREAVKVGVALMGTVAGVDDIDALNVLGVHEEFTLFCAVAIARQGADAELRLWQLANRVNGWGRIQLVERLAGTRSAEIRGWLLREGFRNAVMDEYLAYTCATAGGLDEALQADTVDDALLLGASGIFSALASGGPAEDLGDYAQAEVAVSAWLEHVERRPLLLAHVKALDGLSRRDELSSSLKDRIDTLRNADSARAVVLSRATPCWGSSSRISPDFPGEVSPSFSPPYAAR